MSILKQTAKSSFEIGIVSMFIAMFAAYTVTIYPIEKLLNHFNKTAKKQQLKYASTL